MKLPRGVLIIAGCVVLLVALLVSTKPKTHGFATANEVTAYLQGKYPELLSTGGGLVPRSITIERVGTDWYVAYVQNGSGRPIISARCFRVASDAKVTEQSYTVPLEDRATKFSAVTCRTVQE